MADTEYDRDAQVALAAQVWAQGRGTSPSPGVSWPAPSAQLERVGAGESGQVSPSVCSEGTEHSHTVSTLWASAAKRSPHIQNHRMTPPSPVLRPPTGLPRVWAPPPRFRGDSGGPLMAQGEGRSSPASPRPAEGGANVGGCGPRLKVLRAVGSSWLPRPDPPAPHQDRPPQPFLHFPFAPSLAPATGLHALGTLWEAAASAPCSSGQS